MGPKIIGKEEMQMEYAYQYEQGPIRPPSEAQSLLLRVTRNCTWNRCHFCTLYKGDSFSVRSVEEIKKDIDGMKATGYYEDCRSAFLQDANSIVIQPAKMAEILRYLKERFPAIDRITTYGRADTLSRISVEDYKMLKEAGLNRIHSGYESGSDEVLKLIQKGTTKGAGNRSGNQNPGSRDSAFRLFYAGSGRKRIIRRELPGNSGCDEPHPSRLYPDSNLCSQKKEAACSS
jgi:hypothetical protein